MKQEYFPTVRRDGDSLVISQVIETKNKTKVTAIKISSHALPAFTADFIRHSGVRLNGWGRGWI